MPLTDVYLFYNDFLTVDDINTLRWIIHSTSLQVVEGTYICFEIVNGFNGCGFTCFVNKESYKLMSISSIRILMSLSGQIDTSSTEFTTNPFVETNT